MLLCGHDTASNTITIESEIQYLIIKGAGGPDGQIDFFVAFDWVLSWLPETVFEKKNIVPSQGYCILRIEKYIQSYYTACINSNCELLVILNFNTKICPLLQFLKKGL